MTDAVGSVFPAAQLVVVDGGKVVHEQAVGEATGTTLFDLASLTKPLSTTALALRLIAHGKLSLDDRPRPECTINQLLSHSAGLPGWRALADPDKPGEASRTQAIEAARSEPLEYTPGERSIYSDLGFILLGDAIERAAGARLDVLFKREIADRHEAAVRFGPVPEAAPTENGLRGVVHDENCRAMGGVAGHAGLFGDASAVSKLVSGWVDAWHGDGPCVGSDWVQRAWTRAGVPGSTWGLGWDHPDVLHSSAGLRWPRDGVGHLAFTGCSIWIDPPRRRWTILLSNRVHPTRANEAIKAFRPILGDAIIAMLDG
jgi:CubicO group peptidase (beta-lactamase class C family)